MKNFIFTGGGGGETILSIFEAQILREKYSFSPVYPNMKFKFSLRGFRWVGASSYQIRSPNSE